MHVEESSLEKARRQEQRRLEESERDDGMSWGRKLGAQRKTLD